jgi:hypothetical protein
MNGVIDGTEKGITYRIGFVSGAAGVTIEDPYRGISSTFGSSDGATVGVPALPSSK